jgi:hypothetical protein
MVDETRIAREVGRSGPSPGAAAAQKRRSKKEQPRGRPDYDDARCAMAYTQPLWSMISALSREHPARVGRPPVKRRCNAGTPVLNCGALFRYTRGRRECCVVRLPGRWHDRSPAVQHITA